MDEQKPRARGKGEGRTAKTTSAGEKKRRAAARRRARALATDKLAKRELLTLPWQGRFLAVYAQTRNASWASECAGISRARLYEVRNDPKHAGFAQAWEDVDAGHLALARSREFERGVFGWLEPKFGSLPGEHAGTGIVGEVRKFSEKALQRYLDVHDPARRELAEGGPPAQDEAAALRAALAGMALSVPTQAPPGYVPPERATHVEAVISSRASNTPLLCVGCGHQLQGPAPQCPKCDCDPRTGEPIGNPG